MENKIQKYSTAPVVNIIDLLDRKEKMEEIAKVFLESGLMPKALNTVPKVLFAMWKCQELGLPFLEGSSNMAVINGKVTLQGSLMLALINQSGKCKKMVIEEKPDYCTVYMSRRDYENEYTFKFSLEDAKKAGLLNKEIWKSYQSFMLKWRAVSGCARTVFPEIIGGLYVPEEILSIEDNLKAEVNDEGDVIVIEPAEVIPENKEPGKKEPEKIEAAAGQPRNYTLEAQIRTTEQELKNWWFTLNPVEQKKFKNLTNNRKKEILENIGTAPDERYLLEAIDQHLKTMDRETFFRDKEIIKDRIEAMDGQRPNFVKLYSMTLDRLNLSDEIPLLPF